MADRGRRAFPVSSHIVDEKHQERCWKLHRERLGLVTASIDNSSPPERQHLVNNAKRAMKESEKLNEIHTENLRLLGKLNAIAESDSSKGTQSWTSKSYKSGYVYNPTTSQIHLDNVHIDRGPNAPCGGRSIYDKKKAECEIVEENLRVLKGIKSQKATYKLEDLEKEGRECEARMNRLTKFRKGRGCGERCQTAPAKSARLQSAEATRKMVSQEKARASSSLEI